MIKPFNSWLAVLLCTISIWFNTTWHRKKLTEHNYCRIFVICCEKGLFTILSQHQGTTKIVPLATVVFWPKSWVVAKTLCS